MGDERGRSPQANVRLTTEEDEILRALSFLEGKSVSEILRPAVESFLARQSEDADVKDAVALMRKRRQTQGESNLASIREKLRQRESRGKKPR